MALAAENLPRPYAEVRFWHPGGAPRSGHEQSQHQEVARRLAGILGCVFAGEHRAGMPLAADTYLMPTDTLVGEGTARGLGILSEADLFGGSVGHHVCATKAIVHPLPGPGATVPAGWPPSFPRAVRGVVLPGFTAWSRSDALAAAARLFRLGPVRVKPVCARGGTGQAVAASSGAFERLLDGLDPAAGLVLEQDLREVTTCSIGQVRVADLVISYYGTQRLTPNNAGELVYGGSDLTVARGGFEVLARRAIPPAFRHALAQAQQFDRAASAHLPGFLASRRNYDVGQGTGADGRRIAGVFEQSWRIGGASPAEVLALQAFRDDPARQVLRASSVEVYGTDARAPAVATIFQCGDDPQVGPILKYAFVEPP